VDVSQSLVMDPQNEPFPVPVTRQVAGMQVQEIQLINYPPFVDVRGDGMDSGNPIVSNLPAVTLNWTSPISVDQEKNADRETSTLLQSSAASWLRASSDIQPDPDLYPELSFPIEGEQGPQVLAVAIQGSFESFFKDRQVEPPATGDGSDAGSSDSNLATIEQSPDTARLVVIGSAEFVDDAVMRISSSVSGQRYLNSLQLMQNAVDWSVEDLDLLGIRARGTQTRLLEPLDSVQESTWEFANYAVALVALAAIALFWYLRRRNEKPMALSTR
jgi:ABC-2 type transport system permease protein